MKNVLMLVDKDDAQFLDTSVKSKHWNIITKIIDYRQLHNSVEEVRNSVVEHKIDFLLYTQNDQVAKRARIGPVHGTLKLGYSSVSGIDNKDRISQTQACFRDFVECGQDLNLNIDEIINQQVTSNGEGTFSLIFDTEQIGGVRYGLPRILSLLKNYDIQATFFATNLVKQVYPDVLKIIERHGHEVGLHGLYHEYLSDLNTEQQKQQVNAMAADFETEISGVNFISRMNEDSIAAFINNKIRYFIYPLINYYRLISYPKFSTRPSLINTTDGTIWAFPVSVETYGNPWFSIRNMLDSATLQSVKHGFKHISILCHPFRDGNSSHIQTTHRLVQHLLKKSLKPVTLAELVSRVEKNNAFASEPFRKEPFLHSAKPKISLPQTRWDFQGFIPQSIISLLKKVNKHSLF